MQVVELWRYPVKSMQGESLDRVEVGQLGVVGDRSHALRDDESDVVLTARRDPQLLMARGVHRPDGAAVELSDGTVTADSSILSAWLGRPVTLTGPVDERSTYEIPIDPEDDDSDIATWQGPAGSFHDSTRTQISIVSTGDLGEWPTRRFRPNVVVEAETVDDLVGHRVRIGTVEVDVVKQIDRCVIVTRPQPGGIGRDLDVLRSIRRDRALLLGVGALVHAPGTIAVGDALDLVS